MPATHPEYTICDARLVASADHNTFDGVMDDVIVREDGNIKVYMDAFNTKNKKIQLKDKTPDLEISAGDTDALNTFLTTALDGSGDGKPDAARFMPASLGHGDALTFAFDKTAYDQAKDNAKPAATFGGRGVPDFNGDGLPDAVRVHEGANGNQYFVSFQHKDL